MNKKKYTLVGVNSNAFAVMGYVVHAMQTEGFSREEINAYHDRATSSDYDNLLRESIEMVDKCNEKREAANNE